MIRVIYDVGSDHLFPLPASSTDWTPAIFDAIRAKLSGDTDRALQALIDAELAKVVCPETLPKMQTNTANGSSVSNADH